MGNTTSWHTGKYSKSYPTFENDVITKKQTTVHARKLSTEISVRQHWIKKKHRLEVQFRGVSLEFLKEILGKGKEFGRTNGYGIKKRLTLPETQSKKCSFAELYKDQLGHSGKPMVGKCRFFVSHAWSYQFSKLVEGLEWFEQGSTEREGAYYFLDYFSINQWTPTDDLKSLESIIRLSDALVLVVWPLKKPKPMTRAWCLYELNISIKHNIPIYVTFPEDQRFLMRAQMLTSTNMSELTELTNFKVDSKSAEATKKSDECMVKTEIKNSCGFAWLDMEVYQAVTKSMRILILSELENSESLLIRERLIHEIPAWTRQISMELGKYKQRVDSYWDMSVTTTEGIGIEEKPKSDSPLRACKQRKNVPNMSAVRGCHESLSKLLSVYFGAVIGEEIFYISSIINEYIGGFCTREVSSLNQLCVTCRSKCTCDQESQAIFRSECRSSCPFCSSIGLHRYCVDCKSSFKETDYKEVDNGLVGLWQCSICGRHYADLLRYY